MQTPLASSSPSTPQAAAAQALLRQCVHCGFCSATCPTYQLLGDELDSPRGRIYLIKQVVEGQTPTRRTQTHLDRCLTCRNCESTCPSGVQYGPLIELGRQMVDAQVRRPLWERTARWLLKEGLTSPFFAPALKLGQWVRPVLPQVLRAKVPPKAPSSSSSSSSLHRLGAWPQREHPRKVLLLAGCVQPALLPNINRATARVLDAAGIQTLVAPGAGCCGAIRSHLGDHEGGLQDMRRNIDAWWPFIESGAVEALVMNASGCGVTVKDYGKALADDEKYAAKAERVSAMTLDLSELLPDLVNALKGKLQIKTQADARADAQTIGPLAFHPPCTLQHGQKLRGGVETHLRALGFEIQVTKMESHLCCGSAGTYAVLQADLATRLRDRKLGHLQQLAPACIVSANVGCISHLQSGTSTPVKHWIEVVDQALA